MIIITGAVKAKPEMLDAMIEQCIAHSVRSRAEPGCIAHNVHIDCEDPLRLVFIEQWTDGDAIKAHFAVPESREFVGFLRDNASEPPNMNVYGAQEIDPRS